MNNDILNLCVLWGVNKHIDEHIAIELNKYTEKQLCNISIETPYLLYKDQFMNLSGLNDIKEQILAKCSNKDIEKYTNIFIHGPSISMKRNKLMIERFIKCINICRKIPNVNDEEIEYVRLLIDEYMRNNIESTDLNVSFDWYFENIDDNNFNRKDNPSFFDNVNFTKDMIMEKLLEVENPINQLPYNSTIRFIYEIIKDIQELEDLKEDIIYEYVDKLNIEDLIKFISINNVNFVFNINHSNSCYIKKLLLNNYDIMKKLTSTNKIIYNIDKYIN